MLNNKTIALIKEELITASVLELKKANKFVSGRTAKSIKDFGSSQKDKDTYNFKIGGEEGLKFIIEGKSKKGKLPVRKVGNKFELVQSLKDWKAIKNLDIPDFLLARKIANSIRQPVDIPKRIGERLDREKRVYNLIIKDTVQEIRQMFRNEK